MQPSNAPTYADDVERDALRIQAAAVVAQQAALTEEELRLQGQRAALEQQEKQLAAHLEAERGRLSVLRDKARQERALARKERDAYERRVGEVNERLAVSRKELAESWRQTERERQRLRVLRKRLKLRANRLLAADRAALQRKRAELDERERDLGAERDRLGAETARVSEAILRNNGATEFARRRLDVAWHELREEQARWAEARALEQTEFQDRARELDRREARLAEEEHGLAQQKQQWLAERRRQKKEAEGLESRVRNLRQQLPVDGPPPVAALVPQHEESSFRSRRSDLVLLAEALEDQRLHLAEQWHFLAETAARWQHDREAATAHLETMAGRLLVREQIVEAAAFQLGQQAELMLQQRRRLDQEQARQTADAAAWRAERDRLYDELRGREAFAARRLTAVAELRRRWTERHQRLAGRLRDELAACATLRREWAKLREQWLRRNAGIEQAQRSLAEKALALEQYRQECVSQAANPRVADRRIQRLRRRWTALSAKTAKTLSRERQRLEAEVAALDERQRAWLQHAQEVVVREAECARQRLDADAHAAAADDEHARLLREMQKLYRQRDHGERHVAELREEIERLAGLLVEDAVEVIVPVAQAA